MGKVKVCAFSISLDGFGAGVNQDLQNPLGLGGKELHNWVYGTKRFMSMIGQAGGSTGVDNEMIEKSFENIGAWILGRNMFGPVRGAWPDDEWKGWWGEEPPYHVPVFVLTHYERNSFMMKGNTEFHFVTDGIDAAFTRAKEAAQGKDIRIGGGVSTIRQFLQAGYIDEIHLAQTPALLGAGEHLFSGMDMPALGFNQAQRIEGEGATHFILTKG
jgi:dihydrofolate reductase